MLSRRTATEGTAPLDWFTLDARVIISVVFGLFGGALGGLATAGRIAMLGLRSKERYEAAAAVRGVLNSYLATLNYDHDEVYRTEAFPKRYAGLEGQDELAESILRELSKLPSRTRAKLRTGLITLVGKVPLELAEGRVHLPGGAADEDEIRKRRVTYLAKAIHEQGTSETKGLLSELLGTQNDEPTHNAALEKTRETLQRMLNTVPA